MKLKFLSFFLINWQRKLISFFTAIAIWFLVNHSITTTRTISNIPVRVINITPDQTIDGLLPDGTLSKQIALTLTGKKGPINQLESQDLEVIIDASGKIHEWTAIINKKNLISLNPDIDLQKSIQEVKHDEYPVRLSPLITEKIPLIITEPIGDPPKGFQFVDVWPQQLTLTISGPESKIQELKNEGIKLTFNLNNISKKELDELSDTSSRTQEGAEISFLIPKEWKQVPIPFLNNSLLKINDPDAKSLRINFLKSEFIALNRKPTVMVYYPLEYSDQINPKTYSLNIAAPIEEYHSIPILSESLYSHDVSKKFIDIVKNHLALMISIAPTNFPGEISWSVQFINPQYLEDEYVNIMMQSYAFNKDSNTKVQESLLRQRFSIYMKKFKLFHENGKPVNFKIILENNQINLLSEPSENTSSP